MRGTSVSSCQFTEFLGGISFPIFVVHGPLGQLFYKKANGIDRTPGNGVRVK